MASVAGRLIWPQLLSLRPWTLLSTTGLSTNQLGDVLFKVGDNAFLLCAPYDSQLRPLADDVSVAAVVWAESEGAARRAALQQIEADQPTDSQPPAEVLLKPGMNRYGDIREAGRAGSLGSMLEAASYRGRDGLFVDRRINLPRWTFHFRRPESDDSEPCYAVQVRLA